MAAPLLETPRLGDQLDALEKEVRAWGRLTRDAHIRQLLSLGLESRAAAAEEGRRQSLADSVNYHSKKADGELERVSIRFERHGIYLEHGVGRGRPVGSAAAERYKKPWLAPVLPAAVQDLADRLAEKYADIIAEGATLRVPGIITSKISK